MELVLYKASRVCRRLSELRQNGVPEISASSVRPERDSIVVRYVFGERRAKLCSVTLDEIFTLKRAPILHIPRDSLTYQIFITALSERCS